RDQAPFNNQQKATRQPPTMSKDERINTSHECKIADYVAHRNHSIGRYTGIETLKVNQMHKSFLLINFSGDHKLYVPIDQIDLVQKFVGSEVKESVLYILGGNEWTNVKLNV